MPRVEKPQYYRTIRGTEVAPLLEKQLKEEDNRVISGNVLNGKTIDAETGYVGFFDSQVTVIREGNYYEMFGWVLPGFKKASLSRTFASTWLTSKKEIRHGYQLSWG